MGRKTKLTKEIQTAMAEGIKLGLKIHDVCALAGITTTDHYNWLSNGEKPSPKPVYFEYLDTIKKAKPQRKRFILARIYQAGQGGKLVKEKKTVKRKGEAGEIIIEETITERETLPDWKADAWMLERGYPDEFGRKYQVELRDWRKDAHEAGIEPEEVENAFNRMVDEFARSVPRGHDEGSLAGGKETNGKLS